MIFSTILPEETVWQGFEDLAKERLHEIRIGEAVMVVREVSSEESRIVRLISPNPNDYLDPRYAPGASLRYVPAFLSGAMLPEEQKNMV